MQKAKQWEIIFQVVSNQKEAGVTLSPLDKIDIKMKGMSRDEELATQWQNVHFTRCKNLGTH